MNTNSDLAEVPPADLAPPADMSLGLPREFMVVRVGDGTATLNTAAAPVFVERRQVSDGVLSMPPIALPTAASGTQRRLTLTGNGITEGALSRSADGRYVTLVGYDAAVGTAAVATATTPTIPDRVIARIDAFDAFDTSTAFAPATAVIYRSATSTNGTDLWSASASGLLHLKFGVSPTVLSANANLRMLGIVDGQLYVSRQQNNLTGINKIGTGLPMTGTPTFTLLPGFPAATANGDPYAWVAFDLDPAVPGIDRIYVADNGATDRGVQRWKLQNGTWTNSGAFSMTLSSIGLIGYVEGGNVVLVAVLRTPSSRIISITDDGTSDPTTITPRVLTTAATNMAYRGLAFSPVL